MTIVPAHAFYFKKIEISSDDFRLHGLIAVFAGIWLATTGGTKQNA